MSLMQTLQEIRENNQKILKQVHSVQYESQKYLLALRQIDTHIRSVPEPITYIIETLKQVLPEYKSK